MAGGKVYQVTQVDPSSPYTKGMVYQVSIVGGGNVVLTTKAMPTASADNFNNVYLFLGTTGDNYTHGVIYENKKTATYSATVEFTPDTIDCTGAEFMAVVGDFISNAKNIVKGSLIYYADANLWAFTGKDANDAIVGTFQIYQDDFEAAGWDMPANPQDEDKVDFVCSITESGASYEWVNVVSE